MPLWSEDAFFTPKGNLHKQAHGFSRTGKGSNGILTWLCSVLAACSSLLAHCCSAAASQHEQPQHSEAVLWPTSRGWSAEMAVAWECCTDFHGNVHSWSREETRDPNPVTTLQEPRAAASPWGEGSHCGLCDGCIPTWQGAGAPAIPTSSQPAAGCCRWSLGSRPLAGLSCAKQLLGAAARWKGAGSAGFPPARPAAKQQTQTRGSLGFSSCRGRQRFPQAINALGWIVSLQRYSSSLHVFQRTKKTEELASPIFCWSLLSLLSPGENSIYIVLHMKPGIALPGAWDSFST